MSLEHSSINWNTKQVSTMLKNEKIDLNHEVQRGVVWSKEQKTLFIDSIIEGYDIPKLYAKRVTDDSGKKGSSVYGILDGKQRITTVKQFRADEFALALLPPITYFDESENKNVTIDISGKHFSELPSGLQDIINSVTFNIVYYDNLTREEERELFKRLNNGKPLSAKNRSLASCKNLDDLLEAGEHELFSEMLSVKALENKNQVAIVGKVMCMLTMPISEISFASKVFNPILEQMEISVEQSQELADVLDYFMWVYKILIDKKEKKLGKKMLTETHFISLVPFVKRAMDLKIHEQFFAIWIEDFYNVLDATSISEAYNEASSNAIASNASIVARYTALEESFNEQFKGLVNLTQEKPVSDEAVSAQEEETAEKIAEDISEGIAENTSEEISEDTSEDTSEEATESIIGGADTEGSTEESTHETEQTISNEATEDEREVSETDIPEPEKDSGKDSEKKPLPRKRKKKNVTNNALSDTEEAK